MADIKVRGNASKFGELMTSRNDKSYMRFLMVEERRVQKDGEWVSDGAAFYNATVFGKAAETLDKLVRKNDLKSIGLIAYGRLEPGGMYEKDGEMKQGNPSFAVNDIGLDLTNGDYNLRKINGEFSSSSEDEEEEKPKKKAAPKKPKKKAAPKKPEPVKEDDLFDDDDDLFDDDDDLFDDDLFD